MNIKCGDHSFEVIDYIPWGYRIWSIGKNMVDGYLPLCRLKFIQPFEGCMKIETDTLKAVRCDGAQVILAAVGHGYNTIPKMEEYLKAPKDEYLTNIIKKALPYMKKLQWGGGKIK